MRAYPRDDEACLVGGATKNPYRLLRAVRRVADVAGVVAADGGGHFEADGIEVRSTRVPFLRLYPRTLVWNLVTLPYVFRLAARADLMQCHHPHLGLGAAFARTLGGRARLVVKAHGTALPELRANRYRGLKGLIRSANGALHLRHDRWVLRRADVCIVSSSYQLAEMVETYGLSADRVVTIYNGVDPAHLRVRMPRPEAPNAPRFVFVGRVVPKKGYRRLRDLYTALREQFPQATLTMVLGNRGSVEDPETFRFVREQVEPLPGCRVLFDLSEPELFELLQSCDIGLVPSEGYESIPTVVLEMCAAGLPVFATYRWGIPEVLPEQFGLTGDLQVDVESISQFIHRRLATWDSVAFARTYEAFHYDQIALQYGALYEEVLRGGRS